MNARTPGQILSRARLPFVILGDKLLGRRKPRVVVLVINNACNMRCRYCFGEYGGRDGGKDFTTEELIALIDDLHANGTLYITAHGGEPLLRKDLRRIIHHIKAKGMYINLVTNGILLRQRIEDIREIDSLCISLDGREEGNDCMRGKGAFRAAMDAIDLAKSEGMPLRVQATITKYTRHDALFLAELAREKGFHLQFSLLFGSTPNLKELMPTEEDTRSILGEILELKEKGLPIFTSKFSLRLAMRWPYSFERTMLKREELPPGVQPIPCGYSMHKFTIDADGRAFPCFPLNKEFNALNVKEAGVRKAFEHVLRETTCVLCPFLTHSDWSYTLALAPSALLEQIRLHLAEIL